MPPEKDNPFFAEAGLDVTELKKAVTAAEKFYLSFSKAMGKAVDGLETQEEQHEKTGQAAKKAAKEEEAASRKTTKALEGRFKAVKKIGSGVASLFKREKESITSLGVSWSGLAGLIGGATIVGLIGKAVKDWLEFDKVVRDMNVTMSASPRLLKTAGAAVQGLTGYLDLTREELAGMAKEIGELRMIRGNTEEASRAFRQLTMDTIHLSKSMDVSGESVIGMFDNFTRVYKLPHHKLRNIAASMKFIQEQTSISGQELISFAEGLDDVLARMIDISGKGRAAATADLMAMAGVLKDMGVQPQKVSQAFGEAMKIHSEQGAQFLAFITEGTEKTPEMLRKMMQAGDMETPLTYLIERLKKETPQWLEHNEEWLTEVTGMTFTELRNIQESSSQGLADIFARNRAEYIKGQKHAEEAQKRQHRLSMLWNNLKRTAEKVWLRIGGVFVQVATKVADVLVPALDKMFKKFDGWLSSPEGADAINKWVERTIKWFGSLTTWLVDKVPAALAMMGGFWDKYLKDKFEWLMSPEGGVAIKAWFTDTLDTIKTMAKGIKGIADFIGKVKEALKSDVERAREWMDDQEAMMERGRKSFETHIAERLREGGQFEFGNIKMAATQSNIEPFMAKVAQVQMRNFMKGVERYDIPDKLKMQMVKTFAAGVSLNQAVGYGPTEQGFTQFEQKPEAGTGIFAVPDLPRRATPEAEKIPPTKITTPTVEVNVEKQSPLKVSVKTDSAAQEKILAEIRDALHRILVSGRGHASRVLLSQQQG